MSILINADTNFLIQGITGREGSRHTLKMLEAGTRIVGGVTPEKGGDWLKGIPVFDNVRTAVQATGANATIVFVGVASAIDAIYESADAGVELIVCVTEGIPIVDTLKLCTHLRKEGKTRLIGPNSPGIVTPHQSYAGIVPNLALTPGKVGVVARSSSLAYDVMTLMSKANIGQSTFVGVGGDPVVGTTFVDILALFEEDHDTSSIVLIGESGGTSEIEAANFIKAHMTKPIVAYIAGRAIPTGIRIGHPGAVVTTQQTTAAAKIEALTTADVLIARTPEQIIDLLLDSVHISDQ